MRIIIICDMKPVMPPTLQTSVNAGASSAATGDPLRKAPETAAPNPPVAQRVVPSRQLFGVANEVLIEHAGFTYRLRITQANKLILTK